MERRIALCLCACLSALPACKRSQVPRTVGLALDVGGRGDQSFNDGALRGLEAMAAGLRYTAKGYEPLAEADYRKLLPADLRGSPFPHLGIPPPLVLSGKAQEDALRMLARRGRLSFFGGLPKDKPTITLDSNLVHYRELTIIGANGSSPAHNTRALGLIATGEVTITDLITVALPLDEVGQAIDIVSRGEAIKVTIEP